MIYYNSFLQPGIYTTMQYIESFVITLLSCIITKIHTFILLILSFIIE